MKQLLSIYTAELLKLKRSIAFLLSLLIPILLAALIIIMMLDDGLDTYSKEKFFRMTASTFSIWSIMVFPLFLSIETGLISTMETVNGQWKYIFSLPIPKWKVLFAKWLVLLTVTFIAHTLIVFLYAGSFPFLQLFAPQVAYMSYLSVIDFAGFLGLLCATSIGVISIHFVFSLFMPGLVGNIGLGIGATTLALGFTWGISVNGLLLELFPWTTALSSFAQYMELEIVLDPRVAVITSLGTAMLFLIPGIFIFSRKEIL